MGKFGTIHKSRLNASNSVFRQAEIKRLLKEGVALSKIAKMLDIPYSLAKTLNDLNGELK